jgi:hypothetical protein
MSQDTFGKMGVVGENHFCIDDFGITRTQLVKDEEAPILILLQMK